VLRALPWLACEKCASGTLLRGVYTTDAVLKVWTTHPTHPCRRRFPRRSSSHWHCRTRGCNPLLALRHEHVVTWVGAGVGLELVVLVGVATPLATDSEGVVWMLFFRSTQSQSVRFSMLTMTRRRSSRASALSSSMVCTTRRRPVECTPCLCTDEGANRGGVQVWYCGIVVWC
jgi:hypothetical protein